MLTVDLPIFPSISSLVLQKQRFFRSTPVTIPPIEAAFSWKLPLYVKIRCPVLSRSLRLQRIERIDRIDSPRAWRVALVWHWIFLANRSIHLSQDQQPGGRTGTKPTKVASPDGQQICGVAPLFLSNEVGWQFFLRKKSAFSPPLRSLTRRVQLFSPWHHMHKRTEKCAPYKDGWPKCFLMIYQNDIFPWNDNSICLSCCLQSMVAYGCLWCLFCGSFCLHLHNQVPYPSQRSIIEGAQENTFRETSVKLAQKKIPIKLCQTFPFCFCSFHFLVAPFSNISQQIWIFVGPTAPPRDPNSSTTTCNGTQVGAWSFRSAVKFQAEQCGNVWNETLSGTFTSSI